MSKVVDASPDEINYVHFPDGTTGEVVKFVIFSRKGRRERRNAVVKVLDGPSAGKFRVIKDFQTLTQKAPSA